MPHQTILVIMGSVRAGRCCPDIAAWVVDAARETGLQLELIDLRDWHLPEDDEPDIPAFGSYHQKHTRAWSEKVAGAHGFVIVTPQCNWGYPAPLKNALDHLYKEWEGKPVLILTYGGHGGGKCADQLRQVCHGLKMRPIEPMVAVTLPFDVIRGGAMNADVFIAYDGVLRTALTELSAQSGV